MIKIMCRGSFSVGVVLSIISTLPTLFDRFRTYAKSSNFGIFKKSAEIPKQNIPKSPYQGL